ncbi:TIR domain-containing protein [Histomonas meleagridis]|uniref:TIR domain-containing protein n=1 Tax=Histomonas meleagridis TaxID=135588 RepID=UPI003559EB41|nr:TIR domain-containing protein [Histomonas meleagridis]KAH0798176.1 TIR domain-containing protein [Histomonas meleagridis]
MITNKDILKKLEETQKLRDQNEEWAKCISLTDKYINSLPQYSSLRSSVKKLMKANNRIQESEPEDVNAIVEEKKQKLEEINNKKSEITHNIKVNHSKTKSLTKKIERLRLTQIKEQESLDQIRKDHDEQKQQQEALLSKLRRIESDLSLQNKDLEKLRVEVDHLSSREVQVKKSATNANSGPKNEIYIPSLTPKSKDSELSSDEQQNTATSFTNSNQLSGHSGPISYITTSNTPGFIATGDDDSLVNIYDLTSYSLLATLHDSKRSTMALRFSPSDNIFCTASYDSSVRLYSVPAFKQVSTISSNKECVNDVCFLYDSKLVTCSRDGHLRLFDVNKSKQLNEIKTGSTPHSIHVIGESTVITAHHDGKLRCFDFRANKDAVFEIKAHKSKVFQVIGKKDSPNVVSFGLDYNMVMTDIRAKNVVQKLSFRKSGLPSEKMQMSMNDEMVIYCGGTDGRIYKYDLKNRNFLEAKNAHTHPCICVEYDSNARIAVSGDKGGVVKVWC